MYSVRTARVVLCRQTPGIIQVQQKIPGEILLSTPSLFVLYLSIVPDLFARTGIVGPNLREVPTKIDHAINNQRCGRGPVQTCDIREPVKTKFAYRLAVNLL
ncbi:hypothetical protein DRQ32_02800 [bacterium]|nr:MAG: hypothetical protein DRQ32_02800 [bacterium]